MNDVDVLRETPQPVTTRFEVAATRLADAWLTAGRVEASSTDLQMVREFFERGGCRVRDLPGALVRLEHDDGHTQELTREATILLAFRRLAARARLSRVPAEL